jgi:hypothetical protein
MGTDFIAAGFISNIEAAICPEKQQLGSRTAPL